VLKLTTNVYLCAAIDREAQRREKIEHERAVETFGESPLSSAVAQEMHGGGADRESDEQLRPRCGQQPATSLDQLFCHSGRQRIDAPSAR
jgi:hypothetical protein